MKGQQLKPKEPMIAVIAALIFPGLGQIYAEKWKRGLTFLAIYCLITLLGFGLIFYNLKPEIKTTVPLMIVTFVLGSVSVIFSIFLMIDAYRSARLFNRERNLSRKITTGKRILLIVCGMLVYFLLPDIDPAKLITVYFRASIVEAFKVSDDFMAPDLQRGDRVLVDKAIYKKTKPQKGDIVVFKSSRDPKRVLFKRIVAVAGDVMELKDGRLSLNGQPVENFQFSPTESSDLQISSTPIAPGSVFVLGERQFGGKTGFLGLVDEKNIVGKIYKIYWPPERSGPIND